MDISRFSESSLAYDNEIPSSIARSRTQHDNAIRLDLLSKMLINIGLVVFSVSFNNASARCLSSKCQFNLCTRACSIFPFLGSFVRVSSPCEIFFNLRERERESRDFHYLRNYTYLYSRSHTSHTVITQTFIILY